ncbi:hypothetical protein EUTSA_v10009047mg [Eutrema salsugineum]|uniref:Photosystem I subunit O n=1 Tax=Eutrema salsugineum TaxID=72664 RepID=V4KXL0_EUTSA|nr:hypothetical protein EUTSA_v10009047mg [Eutrema salsugineum]
MAATFTTPSTVIGLGGSSVSPRPFSSSFLKPTLRAKNPLRLAGASGGRFTCIGTELAHFPTPPALTSQFWLWLVTWHLGLFLCLTFGQIGFKGRTEDYFQK